MAGCYNLNLLKMDHKPTTLSGVGFFGLFTNYMSITVVGGYLSHQQIPNHIYTDRWYLNGVTLWDPIIELTLW